MMDTWSPEIRVPVTRQILETLTRDELRQLARARRIPRGRTKKDLIRNLYHAMVSSRQHLTIRVLLNRAKESEMRP